MTYDLLWEIISIPDLAQVEYSMLTLSIWCRFIGMPTMTLFLQALMANILRALTHLTV